MTKKIGILGGGQLARMLCIKGAEMGFEMHVLSTSKNDPAAQVTGFWHKGSPDNEKSLEKFLNAVDIATFESEFLDPDLLLKAQKKSKAKIFPQPKTMGLLQDRLTQKQLLEKHKLFSSPFVPISTYKELTQAYDFLSAEYDDFEGLVLKKRKFGYDGYGTFIIHDVKDLKPLKKIIEQDKYGFIAELFVGFDRELAITACRNKNNQIKFLPLVETHQEEARCLWVKGPVDNPEVYSLKKQIINFLNEINYIGIISFELFETETGLVINEIAPRVHNSAHYSLDALYTDQFSYALRALLNQPLPPVEQISEGFAMYNLLGGTRKKPKITLNPLVKLHWYGKLENRKGRKMGHITAVEDSPKLALKLLKKSLGDFQL
jgi:5-(carboxyamino)imidazole ribonucleotide synthase